MSDLAIEVTEWLGTTADVEDATFGSLVIRALGIPLTEVHDSLAQTTRPAIRVPAILVGEWLVANYWRLRWEPRPRRPGPEWKRAHSLASIGGGFAWPALEISGDGETVELTMQGEMHADAAAIRYLRDAHIEVAGTELDAAIERFAASVESRITTALPGERAFHDLLEELRNERADDAVAHWCRLEARASIDPGEAPDGWREAVERVEREAGPLATEDMLAAAAVGEVARTVDAIKSSGTVVDLSAASPCESVRGKPWERGVGAAKSVRRSIGLPAGPVSNDRLSEVLGLKLPVDIGVVPSSSMVGGYRPPDLVGQARVLVPPKRPTGQRFYFARLLGAANAMPRGESILPITDARTAFQKVTRAFAQELLCPWAELDAWTDEHGTDDEAIAAAAERYDVSELLVATTLVNRGKLERDRLDAFVA